MASGQGDAGSPGELDLDDDLAGVNPDEDAEAQGQDNPADERDEAGGSDGDGGDDAEDAEDEEPQGQARDVAPPRREGRYQRLANENRTLRDEIKNVRSEFERQLAGFVQQQRQPTAAEIAAQQEQERQAFELMTPYEQHQYTQRTISEGVNAALNRDRAALFDRSDKAEFERMLDADPTLKRYEDKVEEYRKQAPGVERKLLLATAIGMAALEGRGRARNRGNKQAEAARERQTARPTNGRGDVRSDRGRGGAGQGSFEHLRNVQI